MGKRILAYVTTGLILALGVMLLVSAAAAESRYGGRVSHLLVQAGRLFMALGLAVVVGLEREARDKPAGVRTVAMVGVGACLFGLIGWGLAGSGDGALSRVIQGIITGVGFLGAGTIIKEQFQVEGLTTAATLWAVAGIGLACGIGRYELAILATVAIFVILTALRAVEHMLSSD